MKRSAPFILFAIVTATILLSCQKNLPANSAPAPMNAPADLLVDNIHLTGGNLVGRWAYIHSQDITWTGNSITSYHTADYPFGTEFLKFNADNTYMEWLQNAPADSGTYTVNANRVHIVEYNHTDSVDFMFGIYGNHLRLTKMILSRLRAEMRSSGIIRFS